MLDVFFESLMSIRIIFLIVATLVVGFGMGFQRVGIVGLIFLIPATLFLQAWLLFTSQYMLALDYLGRTGAAGFSVNGVFAIHIALHPTLLGLGIWFGRFSKAAEDQERAEKAGKITPTEFVRMIDTMAGHPELSAAGWFPQTWAKLNAEERLLWVSDNISGLRKLWASGEETGFESKGADLPMMLAEIDCGNRN